MSTHPEDAIHKAKIFINELQNVQNTYFEALAEQLNLTEIGQGWLFDYVFNSDDGYDGFDHYLADFNKEYEDMVRKDDMLHVPEQEFLPTDFAEYSPMLDMSSYEADLETAFPPAYNEKEPFSLKLDSPDSETLSITLSTLFGINDTQN